MVEALWWLGECSICISIVAQLWWRRRVDQIVFHEWIVTSKKSKATSSVYRAWLSAGGGEFVAIEDSMRFWIQSFGMTLGAVKIYRMWLVAGGSLDVVRDDVLRWLATFGRTKVSQYVYSAWLQAGGKYEVIGDACEKWFERNAESSDAVFLLKYIIRNEYLREPVVRAAIRWCARFAQLPDTIWRVCSLMGRHGNGPYALAITRSLIVTIRFLDLGRLRLKSTSAQRVEEVF